MIRATRPQMMISTKLLLVASVVFYDFQNARTVEAMERLGIAVLSATLGYVESVPNRVFHIFWKGSQVCLGAPNPNDRLDVG